MMPSNPLPPRSSATAIAVRVVGGRLKGCLGLAGLMLCSGCVGLGIPSVRYHDGSPREGRTLDEAILFDTEGPSCADGQCGPLPGEQFAAEDCGEAASVEPPELPNVPWPRFHPLPTAPVFSSR